jgi:GntR family transcriptional regulator, transcriptional repressor for pyruvate dehydrogenase complex
MALTDDAILKIKELIVDGEFVPGSKLPKERELAERLGLSRNSLREAVRALTLIGVLEPRQGDGTYVTSLDAALLLDALSFVIELHQDRSVLELLEARRLLEAEAAALAAVRREPAQIAELRELIEAMPGCTGVEEFVENDMSFHRTIAAAAGNAIVSSLLESLSGRTIRARIWRAITEGGATDRTVAEHEAICDAIERRSPELARAWMTVHVASVEAWLRHAIDVREASEDGAAA